jgi:predicted HTH transcriptional regulator
LAGGNGLPEGLNARQSKAWTGIMAEGSITRARYEELAGGDMSSRTAINDLQDFVDRGVLRKVGRGPATRYVVRTEAGDAQRPERR